MKKNRTNYKWILCIACVLSTTLSCSDKLDLTSPDKLTSDNFWRNAEDAESGLSAAYSQLEAATDVWEFAEVKFPVEAYREDACEIGSDALNYQTWVELYNGNRYFFEAMSSGSNFLSSTLNAWTENNRNTDVPRAVLQDPNGNSRESTRFLESGNFIRLRQLQIGYTLPKNLLHAIRSENLRFYISGQNI
ncbi:MAG: hypothetical protein LBF27_05000, partial [Sphingobacterium sp.]|nr:hypothetical protein [Sphingobacterium sp.]